MCSSDLKPVLVPYPGWYGASEFVEVAPSVDAYLNRLGETWWQDCKAEDVASRASGFAGWYFAAPDWHDGWFLADDANQDTIWWELERVFGAHVAAIEREVREIALWIESCERYFQIFKLRRASRFIPARPHLPAGVGATEDPRLARQATAV